jgi:DNA-directed RNA polymerase subunit RPC12/RpoP
MDSETIPAIKNEKFLCPDCGKKMYLLPDTSTSTYVCPECGCSIDAEDQDFDSEDTRLNCEQALDGNNDRKFIERLFNSNFMKKYTKYDNFIDFILDSGLIPQDISSITYELFQTISREKLDVYIRASTTFSSWDDMFDKATSRYLGILF